MFSVVVFLSEVPSTVLSKGIWERWILLCIYSCHEWWTPSNEGTWLGRGRINGSIWYC